MTKAGLKTRLYADGGDGNGARSLVCDPPFPCLAASEAFRFTVESERPFMRWASIGPCGRGLFIPRSTPGLSRCHGLCRLV
jgi:hypothetical protein